ncbi:MAG: T9SS type A sorting domain-containing protein [Cyclobacteriaceae bacterium]
MLKLFIPLALGLSISVSAQTLEFGWMGGSDLLNQPGIYGTKGIADSENIPGARHYSISWLDGNNIFWLYGGEGMDRDGNFGALSDLWRYDPNSDLWTWVSGSDLIGENSVYGELGVSSPDNTPGERDNATGWTDKNGDVWLFGGGSLRNDLWKYDVESNEWTWIAGSKESYQIPIHGTKGVADANNAPGGRSRGVSWVDSDGKFWIFGGEGIDNNGDQGLVNDLWQFDPSNKEWTWMTGSKTINQSGIYGELGIGNAENVPGARARLVSWTDLGGNFWLFGGHGQPIENLYSNIYNDMWKFSPDNNEWTWVNGDTITYYNAKLEGQPSVPEGSFGTQTVFHSTNAPPAREFGYSWSDKYGKFWLFGGWTRNDLWLFDPAISLWTWMGGEKNTNATNQYGELGNTNLENAPGARSGPVGWVDQNNDLWLFGGEEYAPDNPKLHNDLWFIDAKIPQSITFDSIPDQIFDSLSLSLSATTTSDLIVIYQLNEGDVLINDNELVFNGPGKVSITASQPGDDHFLSSDSITRIFCINPSIPTITLNPLASLVSSSPSGNQWYKDDKIITGATSQTLELSKPGNYYVEVTFGDCTNRSEIFTVVVAGINKGFEPVRAYPNPVNDHLTFRIEKADHYAQLQVIDMTGKTFIRKLINNWSENEFQIDVRQLKAGVYTYYLSYQSHVLQGKFVKL